MPVTGTGGACRALPRTPSPATKAAGRPPLPGGFSGSWSGHGSPGHGSPGQGAPLTGRHVSSGASSSAHASPGQLPPQSPKQRFRYLAGVSDTRVCGKQCMPRRTARPGRGFMRQHPGFTRQHPGFMRQHPGFMRQHPGFMRQLAPGALRLGRSRSRPLPWCESHTQTLIIYELGFN